MVASPVDLTGSDAALGASLSAGLNAAVANINATGGILGHPVKVDYQDTHSDPQTAAQVLTSMLSSGKFIAAIPSSGGTTTLPLLQVIKTQKILAVMVGSEPNMGNPSVYPTLFDNGASFASGGAAMACAVETFHPATAAIIQLDDPFNATVASVATQMLQKAGIKVVDHEVYEIGATNVIPQVQRLLATHPSVLILSTFYFETGPVFTALQQLNASGLQVVGDNGVSSGPPHAVLPATVQIPAGMVALSPEIDVRVGGQLSAQQKAVVGLLNGILQGSFKSSLAQYLYNYDALELVRWAANKAKSTNTMAMVHALETLKAHPESTGDLTQPEPPFSPTNHQYGPGQQYVENYGGQFLDGTFAAIKPVPNC